MNKLHENITGVVMAGGQSSRMGSDKGLILFQGKPMVNYGIQLLSSFFNEVIISTNNPVYSKFDKELIADRHKGIGPLGGIYSVMTSVINDYIFVLSCDMPFVQRNTIETLLFNFKEYECSIARSNNRIQPLCAIYSRTLLAEIERRISDKNYKMYDLILSSNTRFVEFDDEKEFMNINSKEDLNTLSNHAQK